MTHREKKLTDFLWQFDTVA